MGTNYYAIPTPCTHPCEHCVQDDIHIGKSHRMFEAHTDSPWGQIKSWQDWKRIFATDPLVEIKDEYGRSHGIDDFIRDVESVKQSERRKQYDWVQAHAHRYSYDAARDYLDADGFSWTRGEFS